jgi:hypothetical protein
MNDDFWNIISGNTSAPPDLYDLIANYKNYMFKDYDGKDDMAYSYSRGYYNDTRGDEVATAVLEAYAVGVEFETLIKKEQNCKAVLVSDSV